MKPLVIGLGQCSLDILGQVDNYPELDEKAELNSLLVQGGGPVATALVTLSRLGVPVAMAGAVGDDDFGRQIREGLIQENVDCTYLMQSAQSSSQVAFVSVDAQGHRNIFWHRGTAHPVFSERLPGLLSDSVRILHLDGLHLDPAIAAAKLARRQAVTTVLDGGTLRPGSEELLPFIDHLVVSEKFARQFIGRDDPEAAIQGLLGYGAVEVTVTMGRSGSLSMGKGLSPILQPAFAVGAIDTTGCGDVFHGGYVYGLLQNWPLERTLRFAAACAALKARALGGRTAIPTLPEVESFLSSQDEQQTPEVIG
ncbi:MAG: sugar kinase [Deltaproteobacteria bacterium]|nr:MAG: sugar kinase [Deltaproteobacteria bacterium]